MHAPSDPTNLILKMACLPLDILAHARNVCKITHNIVSNGLPLMCPLVTVHLYGSILCSLKKNEETTYMMTHIVTNYL